MYNHIDIGLVLALLDGFLVVTHVQTYLGKVPCPSWDSTGFSKGDLGRLPPMCSARLPVLSGHVTQFNMIRTL